MAVFVVAHGAWSAGWAWKKMRPLLRERGHELFSPTHTGLGERSHLAHPGIDLEAHVADILAVLQTEDLHELILVGHSYGGMVATVVADRASERIAQLVYLDAFVPRDGESLLAVLRDVVVPLYYNRDRDGLPREWIARVKRAIRTLGWRFSADRMVKDYLLKTYIPAAGGTSSDVSRT